MAERLIEILVSTELAPRVSEALEAIEPLESWSQSTEESTIFKILVRAEEVESILDPLQPIISSCSKCRVLVLSVEARFPVREAKPEGEDAKSPAAVNGPTRSKRISREELYEDLSDFAQTDATYLTMVVLSSVVAAGGLAKDSVALLIGAMVIAPLLGPNMALALATTLGDVKLGVQALKTTGTGFLVAVVVGLLSGLVWRVDLTAAEISSRAHVDLGDVVVALVTGIAGALGVTSGLSSSLVGVMVAAALLPPLVVSCMLLVGGELAAARNAFLLLATNVICLNLAGVATFYVLGIKPRTWWEGDRAKKATHRAFILWAFLLGAVVTIVLWLQFGGEP